jgi:glycosyltransferase involved in cell wall biosynthesis
MARHSLNRSTEGSQRLYAALISTDYPPLRTSAAVQMRDLAVEMLRQGHEPIVIVPTVGLGVSWETEKLDGVTVLRLHAPRTRDLGYFRRTLGELSLPFLMAHSLRATPFRRAAWDLVVWYSPTIFLGPLIWSLKRSSGCRTYLILRDIFPEWAVDLGLIRRGPAYAFFRSIAAIQYAVADVIGVQTDSNLKYLSAWVARRAKRVEVLHNWQTPMPNLGSSINVAATQIAGRKVMVYIGNMGVAQGMDILVDLAQAISYREDIGFLFVGRGSEVPRLRDIVSTRGMRNTVFFDEVDSSEMPGLLAQCTVGLLSLDSRHKTHNIPGKFLTYLRAGLPVLARVNPGTDLGRLIRLEDVGRIYDGDSVEPFRALLTEMVDNTALCEGISLRGRGLADRLFSSERAVRQITSVCSSNA